MQFLKTLFWVLVAVLLAVFAFYNQRMVTVDVWRGLQYSIFLPLLVIIPLIVGVLLVWIPHRAAKWSWKRKLDAADRKLVTEREERSRVEDELLNTRNRASVAAEGPVLAPADDTLTTRVRDADGRPLMGDPEPRL